MVGSELQPTTSYEFVWQSEIYLEGDIQFWSVSVLHIYCTYIVVVVKFQANDRN